MTGFRVDLARDLADAVEQQAATVEVLEAIGRTSELEPVFETVLRHAVGLCQADAGLAYQLDRDVFRVVVALGGSEDYRRFARDHPVARDPGSLVGLVQREGRTVHIEDAVTDPRYRWQEAQHRGGFHTMLGVPMLFDNRVLGVVVLWRNEIEPFDERTIRLVTTFAAQGAIAIRNGQLMQALQQRTGELARSVDELRALGDVSAAVAASLDDDHAALTTIVSAAAALTESDGGSIFELSATAPEFTLRACAGTDAALADALRARPIPADGTLIGQVAAAGAVRQAPDLAAEPHDVHVDLLRANGWRSLVACPLRREQDTVGVLLVRRRSTTTLGPAAVDLLETLASQAAVAIHNARAFRELEKKTRELEVVSRHKSEFLASMSHELRTPLNAVIGFSEVLLERMFGDINERQEEYLHDILSSGRHLLELINEVLDLSKIEAGRMELERAALPLSGVLDDCVAMVRDNAARYGVELKLEVAGALGTVDADELRLKQVVLNLLSNAIKFTPAGGRVDVAARAEGTEAIVSVTDTGVGVAEEDRERIFDAFQAGGRGARTTADGTGLGLTLSRRIIDLHGGRLWMESEVGQGSTFHFAVPVADRAPRPDERAEAPAAGDEPASGHDAPGRSRPGTVVVVEDDRRSADLVRVYLEGAGYEVALAGDGVEGLELARRLVPTAVILDIRLPRLSGWDLLARLKGDPATADVPVVIVSMLDERGAGFALGAADYLVKPVRREDLLHAVGRCHMPPGCGRTVVAIDDEPLDLDLVEAALAPEGWTVVRAAGGEEGVLRVREERPAVVLLDLLMPGLDGFEVVEQLRADPDVAHVPIVVLTSKDMTADDHRRLSGRINALARKGTFRQTELAEVVRRFSGVAEDDA